MAVPKFEQFFFPVLKFAGDDELHSKSEATEFTSDYFNLSKEDRNETLESGAITRVADRVGWAVSYLYQAKLVERPKRAHYRITQAGKEFLKNHPYEITLKNLKQIPEFIEFQNRKRLKVEKKQDENETEETTSGQTLSDDQTPSDIISDTYARIKDQLSEELLESIKQNPPYFFEKLVTDLVLAMGYGGWGEPTQKTNDGGIDGIIFKDEVGLERIYLQAKNWKDTTVGRPEIQKFAGALDNKGNNGIFVTTSKFSKEAIQEAAASSKTIILIDGKKLVSLMIKHNVGVSKTDSYEIKEIDANYFSEY